MSTKIGDMAVYLSANTAPLAKDLASAAKMIGGFAGGVKDRISSLASGFASLTKEMIAVAGGNILASGIKSAAAGIGGLVAESVGLAAEMEKNIAAFEVLTGSAEKTKVLMKDIKDYAAASPLSLAQSTSQVKKLIAAGITPDQAVPTLSRLSDAAMGDPATIERLAYAYGQVNAAGRLYGTELKQFTETGIPLIEQLSKVLGKPKDQIKHLVEEGRVGFYELQLAIKGLTDEGGIFYGQSEKYAQTLAGRWDKAVDAFEEVKRAFGSAIIEEVGLKEAAGDVENFADNLKPMVEALRPVIRFVGDLGKGLAQLGAESGKAAFQLLDGVLGKIGKSFPETAKWIRSTIDDLKNFKIDSEGIAQFADYVSEEFVKAIKYIEPYWDSLVQDFVDPIRDVIKSIKDLLASRPLTKIGAALTGNLDTVRKGDQAAKDIATQEWRANLNMEKHGIDKFTAYQLAEYVDLNAEYKQKIAELTATAAKYRSEGAANPNPVLRDDFYASAARRDQEAKEYGALADKAQAKVIEMLSRGSPEKAANYEQIRAEKRRKLEEDEYEKMLAKIYKDAGFDNIDFNGRFKPPKPELDPRLVELSQKLETKFIDPLIKFANDVTDLDKIKAAGRIDARGYALAFSDLVSDLAKNNHLGPTQLAPGLELGSSQLASVIAQASAGNEANSVEGILKSIKLIQDEQLKAAKELVTQGRQPPVVFNPSP